VSACFAESDNFKFWQSQYLHTSFQGNSIECTPDGSLNVFLKHTKEHFKWQCITTKVHNVVMGKMWMDHYGEMEIRNKVTNEKATLTFTQCGWFSKGWHEVNGKILNSKGKECISVTGLWNEFLCVRRTSNYTPPPDSTLTYAANSKPHQHGDANNTPQGQPAWTQTHRPLPADKLGKYCVNWTAQTLELAALDDSLSATLPPTDSRLRKDRLALEKGDTKAASAAKQKIEGKQREEKAAREHSKSSWTQHYFKLSKDDEHQDYWEFLGWQKIEQRIKDASAALQKTKH